MDEAGALVLDPAESPAEGGLDFSLHGVGLVAGDPPPPLHLRVAEAPGGADAASAPGLGDRQRRRRGPGGRRLDDEVHAAVAVGHDLVAVGAVVVGGGGRRVGAVRAVVVGGGHRETDAGLRCVWEEEGEERKIPLLPIPPVALLSFDGGSC